MRNFFKYPETVDVSPALAQLQASEHLWNQITLRTTHAGTVHSEVNDIWLRYNPIEGATPMEIFNGLECVNYPAFQELIESRRLVLDVMRRVEGLRLGRVVITKMRPGARIAPHCDEGAPPTYYDRFHLVLQGEPGSLFRCEDETVEMGTGELWWFNNRLEHEVINRSNTERIHIVMDVRTAG